MDAQQLDQGGNAVLEVLKQMAGYDEQEHESKLATLIKRQIGDAEPTRSDVLFALVSLLEAQATGQDLEITMQAIGNLHRGSGAYLSTDFEIETPSTTAEHQAVANAEAFAGQLATALRQLLFRDRHGTSEGW